MVMPSQAVGPSSTFASLESPSQHFEGKKSKDTESASDSLRYPTPFEMEDPYSDSDEILDDFEYGEIFDKRFYRVEYDFVGRSTLELTVRAGDILTLIVPRDLEGNEEWWLMSNTSGQQGYVPSNYMIKAEYL